MFKPNKVFLLLIVLMMISFSSASGYSPQYVDEENKIPLRWKSKKIPVSISTSLFNNTQNIKNKSDVAGAVKRSLEHWENVANIEFQYSFTNKDSVSAKGTPGDGVSLITIAPTAANLLTFDEDLGETSAVTRLFYTAKGDIREADIVLNPIQLFTTDGTFGSFDLEATLTHEIGHLLGLGHSQIGGSTMHSHQGKNGFYNQTGFNIRTLSEDDKAGAISLYGKRVDDILCCVAIKGELSNALGDDEETYEVWAEDSDTGRVIAGTDTNADGRFNLAGLPKAIYKVFARDKSGLLVTISLGKVDLRISNTKNIKEEFLPVTKDFDVRFVGFNGQLSKLAVPVYAGDSFVIYVGGINLSHKELEVRFHSKNFQIVPDSYLKHNYGKGLSVFSFEVQVVEGTPSGEYSFYLKNRDGQVEHLVGVLTVEN